MGACKSLCSEDMENPVLNLHRRSDLFGTRGWCIPEFGAENKSALFQDFSFCSLEGSRAISKPAPNLEKD